MLLFLSKHSFESIIAVGSSYLQATYLKHFI